MRIARLLAAAALATVPLAGSAATAVADEQSSSSISPNSAKAETSVILSLEGGCTLSSVKAVSKAFTEPVVLSTGSARLYTGTGTVAEVRPGTYEVAYWCGEHKALEDSFTVVAETPKGGVRTGDGGSTTDGSTVRTAAGVTLMATAAASGVYVLRRRAERSQA